MNSHVPETPMPFPEYYYLIVNSKKHMLPLPSPLYKSKETYAMENDNTPFVELDYKNYIWLHKFATSVSVKKPDFNYPFLDYRMDTKNPGICAYRLYVDSDIPGDPPDFIHVQVQKLPQFPWMFLLYYFEKDNDEMVNKLVCICDFSSNKCTKYDLLYFRDVCKLEATEIADKLVTLFKDILIYMRPWAYDEENEYSAKIIEILPFPEHVF